MCDRSCKKESVVRAKSSSRSAWERLRIGSYIETDTIREMIREGEAALPLLTHNPDMGATKRVLCLDLDSLRGMLHMRKTFGVGL